MNHLLFESIVAALKAGEAILDIYSRADHQVEHKSDKSPLTIADKTAHIIIKEYLEKTGLPFFSEEGRQIDFAERKGWEKYWLVDPLDGTKEFISRNGEFTVNIALIENNIPVMGVIYIPVLSELYFGESVLGAFKLDNVRIKEFSFTNLEDIIKHANKLPLHREDDTYVVIASRSHLNEETQRFIDNIRKQHPGLKTMSRGSSLKLCMLAEGKAEVYPRLGPTMEWDIAAGHAILLASGGSIQVYPGNEDLKYNKENLLNPLFIAKSYSA